MPQMRQHALLAVIRQTLPRDGESINLIAQCKHAGGIIQDAGIDYDQAMRLLDQRWLRAVAPEFDPGEEASKLYILVFPVDLSVDVHTMPTSTRRSRRRRASK